MRQTIGDGRDRREKGLCLTVSSGHFAHQTHPWEGGRLMRTVTPPLVGFGRPTEQCMSQRVPPFRGAQWHMYKQGEVFLFINYSITT
jgi:hypothetical protein